MTQLIAACLCVVFGCCGILFVAVGGSKPPDTFDKWAALFFITLALTGLTRTLVLAFV
jgi:hypothetical protein